jgi:hypothetical protein
MSWGSRFDHFAAGFQMNYSWSLYDKLKKVYSDNEPATGLVSTHLLEYLSLPDGKDALDGSTLVLPAVMELQAYEYRILKN